MESQKSCSHTGFWIVIVCLCGLLLMSAAINTVSGLIGTMGSLL